MGRSPPRPWTVPDGTTSLVVRLSKTIVEEAVPAIVDSEPRARLLWDEKLTGFGVYIGRGQPRVRTYFAQRRVHGEAKRTVIDKHGIVTFDQARKRAHKLLVEKGEGIDHAAQEREARARGITLSEALIAHIEYMRKKKRSQRTIDDYESILRKYSGDWMTRPLSGIDGDEVERRHTRIAADVKAGKYAQRLKHRQPDGRKKGAVIKREGKDGQVTANLWQRVFAVIYNSARKRNKKLPENPAATVERFTIDRERRTIKDADLPVWWAGINRMDNAIKRDALRVALFTGLRRASVCELKWNDADFDDAVLHIRKPKGGVSRRFSVPLSPYLVDLLRDRQKSNAALAKQGIIAANSPWIFPATIANPSEHGHVSELRHDIEGVEWQPHDLRRCFARVAERIDTSKFALKSLLNHSQPKDDQTGRYIGIEVERLREPMERITAKMLQLVEPKPASVTPITKARTKSKAKR